MSLVYNITMEGINWYKYLNIRNFIRYCRVLISCLIKCLNSWQSFVVLQVHKVFDKSTNWVSVQFLPSSQAQTLLVHQYWIWSVYYRFFAEEEGSYFLFKYESWRVVRNWIFREIYGMRLRVSYEKKKI